MCGCWTIRPEGSWSMIRVVTLSPAIDITYQVERLVPGESLRVGKAHRVAGGKGLNVARVIKGGGHQVHLVLPLGGQAGDWLAAQIQGLGIPASVIGIEGDTRSCVTVVGQETTVLNEPAARLSAEEFDHLLALGSQPSQTTVFSGSIPAGISTEQLSELFAALRSSSENLIIDTSGAALLEAAKCIPDIVKPNLSEALEATETTSADSAIAALHSLGAQRVLLSLGSDGAVLSEPSKSLSANLQPVSGNPTGAGDAMVALSAISLDAQLSDRELLAKAVAAGALAVAEETAGVIDWAKLDQLAAMVQIKERN